MSTSLSGFDDFLKQFKDASGDQTLDYWADAIFIICWLRPPLVEKRFMGGIALWILWALKHIILTKAKTPQPVPSLKEQKVIDGYCLLLTPAHQESIAPLIDQAIPGSTRIFGEVPDGGLSISYIPIGLRSSIVWLRRWKRCHALWKAIRTYQRITKILGKIKFTANPARDLGVRILEQLFTTELEVARLWKTEASLRSLTLTYELSPASKALVLWARETGARVIHVMHGQRLPTYQVTMATDLVLFSEIDEPWFCDRVDRSVKLWTIGHPRLEMLRSEVGERAKNRPDRLPRIVFFSQPAEGDYTRDFRIRDWRILAGLEDRAELRIRLHPREDHTSAVADLQKLGLGHLQISDSGLKEDLAWCDAVASSWSTVSMEAAACGRGVLWTCSTPEKYEASQELRDHDIGALIQDPKDWDSYMNQWKDGGWSSPVLVSETHLRELGMIGDMDIPWLERLGLAESNDA